MFTKYCQPSPTALCTLYKHQLNSSFKVGGSWVPTADGRSLIGRMVLKKVGYRDRRAGSHLDTTSGASLLGLKIVGGQYINGRYCAVIEKVKAGSVADLVGHLLPGDLVLEWNGISLHTRTYEDVRDIIAASRQEPSIELVVSRDIERSGTVPDWEEAERSNMLTDLSRSRSPPGNLGCRLQVKTWYDRARQELIVTVLSAVDLPSRTGGQYRNPYSKLFLLPDRR